MSAGQYRIKNANRVEAFQWDGTNQDEVVAWVYERYDAATPENVVMNGDGSLSVDYSSGGATFTMVIDPDDYLVRIWGPDGILSPLGREKLSPAEFNNKYEDNED